MSGEMLKQTNSSIPTEIPPHSQMVYVAQWWGTKEDLSISYQLLDRTIQRNTLLQLSRPQAVYGYLCHWQESALKQEKVKTSVMQLWFAAPFESWATTFSSICSFQLGMVGWWGWLTRKQNFLVEIIWTNYVSSSLPLRNINSIFCSGCSIGMGHL